MKSLALLLPFLHASAVASVTPTAVVIVDASGRPASKKFNATTSQRYGPNDDATSAATADDGYYLATAVLYPSNGTVSTVHMPPFTVATGLSGGCATGWMPTKNAYVKATAAGTIMTIDALSGKILSNVTMTGYPAQGLPDMGGETLFAGPDAAGLYYSAEPYSYTSYTILSFNPASGVVKSVITLPKGQMAGIGICVGFVEGGGLFYVLGNGLIRFDLTTHTTAPVGDGKLFDAPAKLDPSHPGHIIATAEMPFNDTNAMNGGQTTGLVRLDLKTGETTTLFKWNATYYQKLCKCGLPIRPQDQSDLAISADGKTVFVVLSYNDRPQKHESLIARGIFVLNIEGDTATLLSSAEAWGEGDVVKRPELEMMAVVE